MNCKYCNAPMDPDSSVCPACGKDNTDKKKLSAGKVTLIVVAVIVLLAVVVSAVMLGLKDRKDTEDPVQTTAAPVTTVPPETTLPPTEATCPPDGDPNNETCKGSYTASDAEVATANDTVVATMGDKVLTNGELQIYYWLSVYNFLDYTGQYAYYYGLDIYEDLDKQISADGKTWQQFFLKQALETWQRYQVLTMKAEEAGYEMEQTYADALAAMPEGFEQTAAQSGYLDANMMLQDEMGAGCTIEDYMAYMYNYYTGYLYYNELCEALTVTSEEVDAYFKENKDSYAENGITEETKLVNIRHILIQPEGGTTDAYGNTVYSESEWETCRMKAKVILDEWEAVSKKEKGFAEMANKYSQDPGSNTNGGLYEQVYQGQMVEEFDAWCFDPQRKAGDTGLVRTVHGYHIMYYVGDEPAWPVYAEGDLLADMGEQLLRDLLEANPIEVDYKAILLGYVSFAA